MSNYQLTKSNNGEIIGYLVNIEWTAAQKWAGSNVRFKKEAGTFNLKGTCLNATVVDHEVSEDESAGHKMAVATVNRWNEEDAKQPVTGTVPVSMVDLYTDGACSGNNTKDESKRFGGYAYVLKYGTHKKECGVGVPGVTNNQMELRGVIEGLRAVKSTYTGEITIHTDSKYVKEAFTEGWLNKWKANGWRNAKKEPIKNKELWEELSCLIESKKINWEWIKGHNGHPENERCDYLATEAAATLKSEMGA